VFSPVYEGYANDASEHTSLAITADGLASVTLTDDVKDGFILNGSGAGSYSIEPKNDMPVGRYEATVTIYLSVGDPIVREAAFQVYPKA
jgi:hypothetical protein